MFPTDLICSSIRVRYISSECSFVTKIINAQETGALGVIVMDNDRTTDDRFVDMIDDSTQRNVQIPAMFLQYRDG